MAPNATMFMFHSADNNNGNARDGTGLRSSASSHHQGQEDHQDQPQQQFGMPPPKQQLRRSPPSGLGLLGAGLCGAASNPMMTFPSASSFEQQEACSCPAPLNQVELQFSLLVPPSPSCSSPPAAIPIRIQTPTGQKANLEVSVKNPTATFCARESSECGHGKWRLQVGPDGAEMLLWLDGVGSLHFWVLCEEEEGKMEGEEEQEQDKENSNNEEEEGEGRSWKSGRQICGGRLVLRERQFLRVPATSVCPKQQQAQRR